MSVVLAVLLCRLFVTCAGVPAGFLSEGVCSTAVAVASLVSLLTLSTRILYMYMYLRIFDRRSFTVICDPISNCKTNR